MRHQAFPQRGRFRRIGLAILDQSAVDAEVAGLLKLRHRINVHHRRQNIRAFDAARLDQWCLDLRVPVFDMKDADGGFLDRRQDVGAVRADDNLKRGERFPE